MLADEEDVFRRVLRGQGYRVDADGAIRVTATAFADRNRQPSVDRVLVCLSPSFTQQCDGNCVLILRVEAVRGVPVENTEKQVRYQADVMARPLPDNAAHCQIELEPSPYTQGMFRKLTDRLARLATTECRWAILPVELRS